jgi:ATP-dependent helicase/nuclease subunit B
MRVEAQPYGDGAFAALSQAVRRAKATDPFSPVTVVVDRAGLSLSVRRRLAAVPPGVAHLRCTTWSRLAAELAAGWLSSGARTVASRAVELEAVRSALVEKMPPRLEGALDQPSTLRALARTYRDLAAVPDGALDALAAQSPRTADVVDVVRRVRGSLAGCVGPVELLGAAAAEVRRAPESAAETCGTVVCYLPRRTTTAQFELLEALATCTDVEVIVGTTGDTLADTEASAFVARLSGQPPRSGGLGRATVRMRQDGGDTQDTEDTVGARGEPSRWVPTWVRSAPSADAEVLMALRHLMGKNAEGIGLERMALLHSGATPYRQLVHDAVAEARIPSHGVRARPLSSTVAGRTLIGALGVADHDWRRDDVIAWIASSPLLHDAHLVAAAEWDALSVEAGIVSGLEQWRERLGRHAAALREDARSRGGIDGDLGDGDGGDPGGSTSTRFARRLELDAKRCDELRAFLDAVAQRLAHTPATWQGWSEWAVGMLGDLLGTVARRAGWPPDEVVAFDAVTEALGRLGALDWLGAGPPTTMDFRNALGAELDAPAPETARFGHGLLVGRLEDAIGLDLDVVCVVGMVDGAFPASRGDDVLVPDRERERAGADVPLRGADAAAGRRDFFSALECARERVLSYSRFDQRHGRELRPARLLLEALEALADNGRRLSASDLREGAPQGITPDAFQFVASFADAVRDGAAIADPVSGADWCLRSLTRWVAAGGWVSDHFLAREDRVLADALAVRRGRRNRAFTRFDGLVEHLTIPSPATGSVQSATGLEGFARCPRRYFFSHLLRVTAREAPETVLQLSPAERGTIIHRVLERLVESEISARATGAADDPSTREARMLAFAEEEFEQAVKRGVTGHPALWALEKSRMTSDLRDYLRAEADYRATTGARPVAVEMGFGGATSEAGVVVGTTAGEVRFRGKIDRVDELEDGWLAVVDYKSGRPYRPVDDADPLAGGERLQLPIYALAAKAAYDDDRKVRAAYWFIGSATPPNWLTVDDAVQSRLAEVVGVIGEVIAAGRFPARPGPSDGRNTRGVNCTYCQYDGMCPPDRGASWRRKRTDPALSTYVSLVGQT